MKSQHAARKHPKPPPSSPLHVNKNGFSLYALPYIPEKGVSGIAGNDNLGKSTSLLLLAGKIEPSNGWYSAVRFYGGTQLGEHLKRLDADNIRVSLKPQNIARLRHMPDLHKNIEDLELDEKISQALGILEIAKTSDLEYLDSDELQLVSIAAALSRNADLYLIDQPTDFLDITQRLKVASTIKELSHSKSIVVADHDIAFLDFVCSSMQIFYGESGKWSSISNPYQTSRALAYILGGFIPEEKIALSPISFRAKKPGKTAETLARITDLRVKDRMEVVVRDVKISRGSHIAIIGEKGTGKSLLMNAIAGKTKIQDGVIKGSLNVSLKTQHLSLSNMKKLLRSIKPEFINVLSLPQIVGKQDITESWRQKTALLGCLAKEADIYLLDEPTSGLDVHSRLALSQILSQKTSSIVIDHDIFFLLSLCNDAWELSGEPQGKTEASQINLKTRIKSMIKKYRLEPHKSSPLYFVLK